jgi:hypothetical protein
MTDIKICLQIDVYESGRSETWSNIEGLLWLLLDHLQSFRKKCVRNCGVVERALYGGLHGGLYCLCQAIEIELFPISLGSIIWTVQVEWSECRFLNCLQIYHRLDKILYKMSKSISVIMSITNITINVLYKWNAHVLN